MGSNGDKNKKEYSKKSSMSRLMGRGRNKSPTPPPSSSSAAAAAALTPPLSLDDASSSKKQQQQQQHQQQINKLEREVLHMHQQMLIKDAMVEALQIQLDQKRGVPSSPKKTNNSSYSEHGTTATAAAIRAHQAQQQQQQQQQQEAALPTSPTRGRRRRASLSFLSSARSTRSCSRSSSRSRSSSTGSCRSGGSSYSSSGSSNHSSNSSIGESLSSFSQKGIHHHHHNSSSKKKKKHRVPRRSSSGAGAGNMFMNGMKTAVMAPVVATQMAGKGSMKVVKGTTKVVVKTGKASTKATMKGVQTIGRGTVGTVQTIGRGTVGTVQTIGRTLIGGIDAGAKTRSKWDDAIDTIDELMTEGTDVYKALTPQQLLALADVKSLLMDGLANANTTTARPGLGQLHHLPLALIKRTLQLGTDAVSLTLKPVDSSFKYIMTEFGGVNNDTLKQQQESIRQKSRRTSSVGSNRTSIYMGTPAVSTDVAEFLEDFVYCPPEFERLSKEVQKRIIKILSWSNLKKWDFNVFDLAELTNGQPLFFLGWAILGSPQSQYAMMKAYKDEPLPSDMLGYNFLDSDLEIPPKALCNYLRVIEKDYCTENPYHNNIHAADVLQSLHAMLQMIGENFETTTLEMFTILLSAVVHDVNHTGMNNVFEINTKSETALLYNDISVLENRHAAHAFFRMYGKDPATVSKKLFRRSSDTPSDSGNKPLMQRSPSSLQNDPDNTNVLCRVGTVELQQIRTMLVDAVLHTDMSKHFQTVSIMKALAVTHQEKLAETPGATVVLDDDSRWKVLMYMLHLADISSQAKPAPLFYKWTERCFLEFFHQGDKEAELGLPISPNCDRKTTNIPGSQVGFINFVIQPAYEVLGAIVPPIEELIVPQIKDNCKYWELKVKEEEKKKQQEEEMHWERKK